MRKLNIQDLMALGIEGALWESNYYQWEEVNDNIIKFNEIANLFKKGYALTDTDNSIKIDVAFGSTKTPRYEYFHIGDIIAIDQVEGGIYKHTPRFTEVK